jgi:hypothetical protein
MMAMSFPSPPAAAADGLAAADDAAAVAADEVDSEELLEPLEQALRARTDIAARVIPTLPSVFRPVM